MQPMKLRRALLKEMSKANTVEIADSIGANQADFDRLMAIVLSDDNKVAQRAAWVMSHCADSYPWLVEKHVEALLLNLRLTAGDAVKRNSLRVLKNVDIPEIHMGIAADLCFGFLNSTREPIAVRVHAMVVLLNIAKRFPELGNELKQTIKAHMPYGSAGFKSIGRKTLNTLSKMSGGN
jgi:hypothetical protein